MSTSSPCSSAHIADDVDLYGDANTYKHFLTPKYAAESTSDGDSESHSNNSNLLNSPIPGSSSPVLIGLRPAFQTQQNYYPFSPLVSSSSSHRHHHLDTSSSIDSFKVESSSSSPPELLFEEAPSVVSNNNVVDYTKQVVIVANRNNVTSSSASAIATTASTSPTIESTGSNLFESITPVVDGTNAMVDSTTTTTAASSPVEEHPYATFASYEQHSSSSLLGYGSPSVYPASIIQIETSGANQLLPSLSSPTSAQIDQYFIIQQPQHQTLPKQSDDDNHHLNLGHQHHNQFGLGNESEHHHLVGDTPGSIANTYLQTYNTGAECSQMMLTLQDQSAHLQQQQQVIIDSPVQTRALASLPTSHLYLQQTHTGMGVFARATLLKHAQLGPIEGDVVNVITPDGMQSFNAIAHSKANLVIFLTESTMLTQTDEQTANWTRFLRRANTAAEQNLELVVKKCETNEDQWKLFFYATRDIQPNEELKVWYSTEYGQQFGIKPLEDEHQEASQSELGHKLRNKLAKQQMTNEVKNEPQDEARLPSMFDSRLNIISDGNMILNADGFAVLPSITTTTPTIAKPTKKFACDVCHREFPRRYSLARHKLMHSGGERKYKCPSCSQTFNHTYNLNRHYKKHSKPQSNDNIATPILISIVNDKNVIVKNCADNSMLPQTMNVQLGSNNIESHDGSSSLATYTITSDNLISAATAGEKTSVSSPAMEIKEEVTDQTSEAFSPKSVIIKNRPYRCGVCYKRFSSEERLVKHGIVHDDSAKHLSCHICTKKFVNNSALSWHIKSHDSSNERRKYECILCSQVFDSVRQRRKHFEVHINPDTGLYPCPKCPKEFKDFSPTRKHIKAFHSGEIFPCPQCEKVFPRQDKLRLHMLCHTNEYEFKCPVCPKEFKRKDKLKEHTQRIHAPDREERIARKQAAKIERLKVTPPTRRTERRAHHSYKVYVYKCQTCLIGFKRRGMLVNHLAKRHPEVPYNSVPELNMPIVKMAKDYFCNYCEKVYKSSSKRKAHILKNHPGQPLPASNRVKAVEPGLPNPSFSATTGRFSVEPQFCRWCPKQYASKPKLLQHQRKKHPEKLTTDLSKMRKLSESKSNMSTATSTTTTLDTSPESVESSLIKFVVCGPQGEEMTTGTTAFMTPDSMNISLIKSEEVASDVDEVNHTLKLDNVYLHSPLSNGNVFIDGYGLNNNGYANKTTMASGVSYVNYLHNPNDHNSNNGSEQNHFQIDSLDDYFLSSDHHDPNLNMIVSGNSAGNNFPNNVLILSSIQPSSVHHDLSGDFPDIMQLTSEYGHENGKTHLMTAGRDDQVGRAGAGQAHNETNGNDNANDVAGSLLTSDSLDDGHWSRVCEEMTI